MHGIRVGGEGDETNVSNSDIMHIIKKSERSEKPMVSSYKNLGCVLTNTYIT